MLTSSDSSSSLPGGGPAGGRGGGPDGSAGGGPVYKGKDTRFYTGSIWEIHIPQGFNERVNFTLKKRKLPVTKVGLQV